MSVFVRCARCGHQAELDSNDGWGLCPSCGAFLEVASPRGCDQAGHGAWAGQGVATDVASEARATAAEASPKERMLGRIERIAPDAGGDAAAGIAQSMREAMRACIDEIRDGSRTPAGELGALLDAGRSYAVASFGIWNELRSRGEALERDTPARRRAELVADEALCAGDAGVIAVIRAIDDLCSRGQRLEPVELDALVNLWQTVHDFDRYPLSAMRVDCLRHGYGGLCEGEDDAKELSEREAELALYEVYECAEAGNVECALSICERVLKALPDNAYASIMAGVAREVIACDTVVATTHFHDFDEAVEGHILELRGEPFRRVSRPAVAGAAGAGAGVPEREPSSDEGLDKERGADLDERLDEFLDEFLDEDVSPENYLEYLKTFASRDPFDYEVDADNLWRRQQGLRDLAVCLEGMVKGVAEHTQRVLGDCEGGRVSLSEEVVASVRAQHDDAAGALSLWMRMVTREMEDMLALGLYFDEDWEVALWKHIFLAVDERDRDRLWHLSYEDLRHEFEDIVEDLERQEKELLHEIADAEIAHDRKRREIDRALSGDPAVLERLRAEASMLEYNLAMLVLSLDEVRECFETRDWDELDENGW